MPEELVDARDLDLTRLVRAEDLVVWGQACAEPQSLTEQLIQQRAEIGHVRCFLGIPTSNTVRPEHGDHMSFVSYSGSGANRALYREGLLDIVPVHYSHLPRLLSSGSLRADVVFVQVSSPDDRGRYSMGLADDYLSATLATARVVVAEVNDQVPRIRGSRHLTKADFDVIVYSSRPPAESIAKPADAIAEQIAANVAEFVEDGATLQFGVGALPEAVLAALGDRTALGVHSGLINDAAADLMEAGVVTNARKTIDRNQAVAGFLMGSDRLFRFAETHSGIRLRETSYTHDPDVLAAQDRLVAINSAIEVDASGQVNAEVAGGTYVGALGGAGDFLRGAARSSGGVPIIALPATAGNSSRIVETLSGPVSTPRCDVGVVVTEFGSADLRGQPLRARRERMLAIAHPDHQRELQHAFETTSGAPA